MYVKVVKLSGHGGRSGHRTAFAFLVLPPSGTSYIAERHFVCIACSAAFGHLIAERHFVCIACSAAFGHPIAKRAAWLYILLVLSSPKQTSFALHVLPSSCTLHDIITPTTCSSKPDLYVLHPNIPRSYNATNTQYYMPYIYRRENSFFTSARLHYTARLSHLAAFGYPFAERVGTWHYPPSLT